MSAITLIEMLKAESEAIESGWTEDQLLELAGSRLGHSIGRFFPGKRLGIAYLGKGHNAGDAVVALRILRDHYGWDIGARMAYPIDQCSPLMFKKWLGLGIEALETMPDWRETRNPIVLIDGLLGSGGRGPMRHALIELAGEMQWLRQNTGARVAAVDLPSGMDADSGMASPGAVIADMTFMIANPKRGLVQAHAAGHVGALSLVPVEALTVENPGDFELISPQAMNIGKAPRRFDFHKGMAGRIAIIAGSESYPGAAVLAATGALRGGGGLIMLYVPEAALARISPRCPPEIIIRSYESIAELQNLICDSLVIGCGLGTLEGTEAEHLLRLIEHHPSPAVLDADALNLIAKTGRVSILKARHVITPHPGEFKRLAPDLAALTREEAARVFADRCPATLLLKGSRTLVTGAGFALWCNSTGTPGMATGGQGDLLAGVLGAQLATGIANLEAAAISAWLCGRAAEIAIAGQSEESLTPGDVASCIGKAFLDWKASTR